MFFDAALLALGDVRSSQSASTEYRLKLQAVQILFLAGITCVIGPQKVGCCLTSFTHTDEINADLLLLCKAEQDKRDDVFSGRSAARVSAVSVLGHASGSLWLSESVWVRDSALQSARVLADGKWLHKQRLLPCCVDLPAANAHHRSLPQLAIREIGKLLHLVRLIALLSSQSHSRCWFCR